MEIAKLRNAVREGEFYFRKDPYLSKERSKLPHTLIRPIPSLPIWVRNINVGVNCLVYCS